MVPVVKGALKGWMKKYAVTTYSQDVDSNHEVVNTPTTRYIMLNKQPTPPEVVARKPEEQRHWKFWDIHTTKELEFNIDDRFEIEGVGYKIKGKYNYKESGYFHYECIEDFQDIPTTSPMT